jgi:hypothetical protein
MHRVNHTEFVSLWINKKMQAFKNSLLFMIGLFFLLASCRPSNNHIAKKTMPANNAVSDKKDAVSGKTIKKDTIVKKTYPLTDSGQLMLHVDSLAKVNFPYHSENESYSSYGAIDLSALKNKKLFHIAFKPIPMQLGGGSLDEDLSGRDSTFDLADSTTYKARWNLIAATPEFIVVDVGDYGILATLSYKLDVIDAIHIKTGVGNNHWQIWREAVIDKDLAIHLKNHWSGETYRKNHFEYENEAEMWFIDDTGRIKQLPVKHRRPKNTND